jgi:hypothetical protein
MQNHPELLEIGKLRTRSRSLLKTALLSIRRTDHHEMPLNAIFGQYLDKGRPVYRDGPIFQSASNRSMRFRIKDLRIICGFSLQAMPRKPDPVA